MSFSFLVFFILVYNLALFLIAVLTLQSIHGFFLLVPFRVLAGICAFIRSERWFLNMVHSLSTGAESIVDISLWSVCSPVLILS